MVIERLDDKGRGIGFIDGKITFVNNALPLEDVEIKITKVHKKYNEAIVIKYNKKSEKRLEPICPYFNICGGCDLMHMSNSDELEFKKNKVENILKKFAKIDIEIDEIISPLEYHYRNKATFKVKDKIGYYKKREYEIIAIDKCYLVNPKINLILDEVKKHDLKNIDEIIIKSSFNMDDTMLYIKSCGDISSNLLNIDVKTIINNDKILKGKGYIKEKLGNYTYIISPDSFFQINSKGAEILYDKILEYASFKGNERVLDLYCGTGSIGIYINKYVKKVLGIEINESAVKDANFNKKENNLNNIDFICSDASDISDTYFDVIIVDPPRSGLNDKTINKLLELKVSKIIYVSCDPITLARDLNILKENYILKKISLVNMFSKTEHCESITVLEKIDS